MRTGCLKNPVAARIAAAHHASAAQVCLRWVTQQADAAVVSTSSAAYDKEDLASTALTLTAAEMAELSRPSALTSGEM